MRIFINLTNGLEHLKNYQDRLKELSFVYIASTTIEQRAWCKLIGDLDHNLLLNLAIGNNCLVVDCGTNRVFSKTIYLGIPLIKYILTRYWLGIDDPNLCYRYNRNGTKGSNEYRYFSQIYEQLFLYNNTKEKEFVKTKLKKYKNKFLLTNTIKLHGTSYSTTNDGRYDYFKDILKQYKQHL